MMNYIYLHFEAYKSFANLENSNQKYFTYHDFNNVT